METVGRTVGAQESTDTVLAFLVRHDYGAYFKPTASAFQLDEEYSFQYVKNLQGEINKSRSHSLSLNALKTSDEDRIQRYTVFITIGLSK